MFLILTTKEYYSEFFVLAVILKPLSAAELILQSHDASLATFVRKECHLRFDIKTQEDESFNTKLTEFLTSSEKQR